MIENLWKFVETKKKLLLVYKRCWNSRVLLLLLLSFFSSSENLFAFAISYVHLFCLPIASACCLYESRIVLLRSGLKSEKRDKEIKSKKVRAVRSTSASQSRVMALKKASNIISRYDKFRTKKSKSAEHARIQRKAMLIWLDFDFLNITSCVHARVA